jgi:hypothetical protein
MIFSSFSLFSHYQMSHIGRLIAKNYLSLRGGGVAYALDWALYIHNFALFLIFCRQKIRNLKNHAMTKDTPLLPLPNVPSATITNNKVVLALLAPPTPSSPALRQHTGVANLF